MNKDFIKKLFLFSFVCLFVLPVFVFAQTPNGGGGPPVSGGGGDINFRIKLENPFNCNNCTLSGFVEQIIKELVLPIGGLISVLMIIWAGFLYVTAGTNSGQITKAHDALLWGVIGAAILLGAWIIAEAVKGTVDQLRV